METNALDAMRAFFRLTDSDEARALFAELEAGLVRTVYEHGEIICQIGDGADCMYFIESGIVEVLDKENQPINEMGEGAYFGEFAVLTGGVRLSTVASKGGTIVYRMDRDLINRGLTYNPAVYGNIIQQLYGQISQKHVKIRSMASRRRGIIRADANQKKMSTKQILINYGIIAIVFLFAMAVIPRVDTPIWYFLPIVFLMAGIVITKRTLESFVLACMLTMIMLYGRGFLVGFYNGVISVFSDVVIMEIVIFIALLGAITKLLLNSGAINALRRLCINRIKTRRGSLLSALLCMIVIFIDDHLSMEVAGICLMPVNDEKGVPREMSALILGMAPGAVNLLVPFSVWGVFLSGILIVNLGDEGLLVFFQSIPFNFAAILTMIVIFIAAIGKLPLIGGLKRAQERVEKGGHLWPPNSEDFFHEEDKNVRGNIINLLLPLLLLPAASVAAGVLLRGGLSVHIGAGIVITLLVMFGMYIFQKIMTPEEFFDNIISGIEYMVVPIVLLVLTFAFSGGIKEIGLVEWLGEVVPSIVGGQMWLLPAVIFLAFAAMTVLWGSSWSIYGIGLPIAIQLAIVTNGSMPLFAGAVCAAGIIGDSLSIHQSDNEDVAAIVGCEPTALFMARLPYFAIITILTLISYIIAGRVLI